MDLIALYGSSDEDVPSSESKKRDREEEETLHKDKKQKTEESKAMEEEEVIELPQFFDGVDLKANPTEHQGRKRAFPHLKVAVLALFVTTL